MKQDPQDNLAGDNYDPLLCESHTVIKLLGGTQHRTFCEKGPD
jgi:hypothetical protein